MYINTDITISKMIKIDDYTVLLIGEGKFFLHKSKDKRIADFLDNNTNFIIKQGKLFNNGTMIGHNGFCLGIGNKVKEINIKKMDLTDYLDRILV